MLACLSLANLAAQQPLPASSIGGSVPPGHPAAAAVSYAYAPHRVYDTRRGAFVDFERMLADGATSDVLFLGEQHDDPVTHALEAATLEGIGRRRGNVILAMDMFERDAQDRKSTRLNSSHIPLSRMPSSA